MTSAAGTKIYMAPEMIKFLNNSFKDNLFSPELCDVFSLGVSFI